MIKQIIFKKGFKYLLQGFNHHRDTIQVLLYNIQLIASMYINVQPFMGLIIEIVIKIYNLVNSERSLTELWSCNSL